MNVLPSAVFRLFRAPLDSAADYVESATCHLCAAIGVVGFTLGIGADLIVACAACGTENPLDAEDAAGAPCRECNAAIDFPLAGPVVCCGACLRAGRAAITKDTPLGMVRWIDAIAGVTDGTPDQATIEASGFEVMPPEHRDGWVRARVSTADLLELVRTPSYVSWQGDQWLFHCRRPMAFVAECREARELVDRAGTEPAAVQAFAHALDLDLSDSAEAWAAFAAGDFHGSLFVFACDSCRAIVAHWDCD